ncbi:hypothetical protein JHW43_000600 [Diplocarpon mali]|nr:hypothetical protein JHW43_000600 [Diplocarpon mali]
MLTPTIKGVVGNPGAGKSSVINAILEEERLVPTNCILDIALLTPSAVGQGLETSLTDWIDSNGQVSRECTNPESEAGVSYAKIKAGYPSWTKDELAHRSVEELMGEDEVKNVLGTTRTTGKSKPEFFYKALQNYVDSKENALNGEEIPRQEDANGILASNQGRLDIHESRCFGHSIHCTAPSMLANRVEGLFIFTPINRAVEDEVAKSLLGGTHGMLIGLAVDRSIAVRRVTLLSSFGCLFFVHRLLLTESWTTVSSRARGQPELRVRAVMDTKIVKPGAAQGILQAFLERNFSSSPGRRQLNGFSCFAFWTETGQGQLPGLPRHLRSICLMPAGLMVVDLTVASFTPDVEPCSSPA